METIYILFCIGSSLYGFIKAYNSYTWLWFMSYMSIWLAWVLSVIGFTMLNIYSALALWI